jgi:hypothetical protein
MHPAARTLVTLVAGAFLPVALLAQAPKGATAKCKDGTYSTSTSKQGMCSSHGGVAQLIAARRSSPARSSAKPAGAPVRHATAKSSRSHTTAPTRTGPKAGTAATPPAAAPSRTRRAAPSVRQPAPAPPRKPATGAEQLPTVAAPAGAPAGATAMCKDGTYSTSKVHTGACSHHGGVKEWLQETR